MKGIAWAPIVVAILALSIGAGVMALLIVTKEPLAQASVDQEEKRIAVYVEEVAPESVPVALSGFGHVKALKEVAVVPEVSGKITSMHPNLVVGGVVAEGEVLFQIDARSYEARVAESRAALLQQEQSLMRLDAEEAELKRQVNSARRAHGLAVGHLKRAQQLREGGVGTQSSVDQAEQTVLTAKSELDRSEHSLALVPLQRQEAQSMKASAEARLSLVELELDNTTLKAPFNARIKERKIEEAQVVSAGTHALTLVDDTVLEVRVPLDSRDASQWLQFEESDAKAGASWFSKPKPVDCTLRWTEAKNGARWKGKLDRVESFDPQSHTLSVVIRVTGAAAHDESNPVPLVEGMFCEVTIPGRPLESVYRVPQNAVTIDNMVYLSVDERLKTVPVTVARVQGEDALVSSGLNPGDQLITTRLVNPLDNTLLDIEMAVPATVDAE